MSDIINLNHHYDKFGFYQVGNLKYYSKLEAIEAEKRFGGKLHFNFNDEVFDTYNWEQEPAESITELYQRRAQNIREQYDHVVVWFSGGADSTQVLESFIDNDIKIDEIASYVNYEATGSINSFLNTEIYHVAIPYVEKIKQKQPWIEHTLVDVTPYVVQRLSEKSSKFDWIYGVNQNWNPNSFGRTIITEQHQRWSKLIDSGQRVVHVWGVDKPIVNQVNSKFYFRFNEIGNGSVQPDILNKKETGIFNEFFFWDPGHAKIPIKQGHLIKNFLKHQPLTQESFNADKTFGSCSVQINNKICWINSDIIKKIVYPSWRFIPYQCKPSSTIFNSRDEWFWKLSDTDQLRYNWNTGITGLWQKLPDYWKVDASDLSKGVKYAFSKSRCLGE